MHSQYSTEEKQHHVCQPTNMFTTQQLNGILFQMTSRRTQHEPVLTLQLIGSPVQMSSRRSNQNWVKYTKYQHWLNKLDARPPYGSLTIVSPKDKFSSRSQHFTSMWSPTLHLYVKSNSSLQREVQINFSRTQIHQIVSYRLHHQTVVPMWLPTYLA